MKVDKARELIIELENYVAAYEAYDPTDVKEMAIKLYSESNNVGVVAKELNELGYRKEGKLVAGKRKQVKYDSNDVTAMINTVPADDDVLHDKVRKMLNKNRRRKGIVS